MGKDCVRDISWGQTKKGSVYVAKECVTYVNGDGEPVNGLSRRVTQHHLDIISSFQLQGKLWIKKGQNLKEKCLNLFFWGEGVLFSIVLYDS